jgi:hypothetical protein
MSPNPSIEPRRTGPLGEVPFSAPAELCDGSDPERSAPEVGFVRAMSREGTIFITGFVVPAVPVGRGAENTKALIPCCCEATMPTGEPTARGDRMRAMTTSTIALM